MYNIKEPDIFPRFETFQDSTRTIIQSIDEYRILVLLHGTPLEYMFDNVCNITCNDDNSASIVQLAIESVENVAKIESSIKKGKKPNAKNST